ncbi:hypothetical protein LV89_04577 [Arcicella aurantiaca]|uniref:Lipoprotein n=1 Tax=Arcicella aurantiaca TaxID=591202 RepID=A0A316DK23_9BACT|nr:hypothetical protein [Arcicella aurantiaca]PWK17023.1 hypothetical protein LV89_04577 [Arcicella aurantiaca]
MKKLFYSLAFVGMLVACSEKKNTTENLDSINAVQSDSSANKISKSEIMYLEDVLQCVDLKGLEKKYGAENVKKDTTVTTGEGDFKTTMLFPGTAKEIEIYWKDGEDYKKIQDVLVKGGFSRTSDATPSSPWESKEGLRLGMKMSEVIALNGKTFTITGLGWDLGGNVVSWEGGKMANKNISIRFNDYSNNMGGLSEKDYSSISGDREFDTQHPAIIKLNPIVDELSVYLKPDISPELGQKMTKEVEKKQIPR